jgi:hypothetical protein
VDYFLTVKPESEGSGSLSLICENGLYRSLEDCTTSCSKLSPCIPEGSEGDALRDEEVCQYYCAVSDDINDDSWSCLAQTESCEDIPACF